MMFYSFLVIFFFLSISSIEGRIIKAERPINQTCLNLGHKHDCQFYSCFEERFPCGPSFWISKWGKKYCLRMQESRKNFDADGQKLIEQISRCLTDKLVKQRFYSLNNINCEQLRSAGQRIVHECYLANAKLFCQAIEGKNAHCFSKLLDNEDQHDFSIIRTLSSVGQRCSPKKRLVDMRPKGKTNQCPSTSSL